MKHAASAAPRRLISFLLALALALAVPLAAGADSGRPYVTIQQSHYVARVGEPITLFAEIYGGRKPFSITYALRCEADRFTAPRVSGGLSVELEYEFVYEDTGDPLSDTGRKTYTWLYSFTEQTVFTFVPTCRGVYNLDVQANDARQPCAGATSIDIIVADDSDAASSGSAWNRARRAVSDTIRAGMTDRQKASALHGWVETHMSYSRNYGTEEALLSYRGVCENYARLYALLCSLAGLECRVIDGNFNPETYESHAWNVVRIEGEWLHVDCTWDDKSSQRLGGDFTRRYLMLPSHRMAEDHSWETEEYPWLPYPG